MENAVVLHQNQNVSVFDNSQTFEHAQRMAGLLSKSTMVPTTYQGNLPNCVVALEMSSRVGMSPLMVMQNMNVIHGKPSWGSSFIIALINNCGRFAESLKFKIEGEGDLKQCYAYTSFSNGETIKGPTVSIAMAIAEGWMNKSGSKWKTMPELMLQYRSAAFFGRLHCPDVLMGMQTQDEVIDVGYAEPISSNNSKIDEINKLVSKSEPTNIEVIEPEIVTTSPEEAFDVSISPPPPPIIDENDDF